MRSHCGADVTETFDTAVQGAMAVGDVTVKNGQLTHGVNVYRYTKDTEVLLPW